MTQPPDWSSQAQGPSDTPAGGYAPPPGYPPPPPLPPPPPVGWYGYGSPAGAGAPPGTYFDQLSGLVLPDGVELASAARRVGQHSFPSHCASEPCSSVMSFGG